MVLVMLVGGLLIVGLVLRGARDVDLSVARMETLRAEYAAEAGSNMAMREIMLCSDQDGDGGVGSISNDGNSANNPAFSGATVYATRTNTASGVTIDIYGSTSVARRHLQFQVTNVPDRMVIYGEDPSTIPVTRTWNGLSWSAEAATNSVGGKPRWVVAAACPVRNEIAMVACDDQRDVNVMVYSGATSTWSSPLQVSTNIVTKDDRPLYLAYEQLSGDALVVYRVGSSSSIYYRIWNGTSWSAESSTTTLGSGGGARFTKLIPKPGTDEIMMISLNQDKDITAMIWNGSAWGNKILLDADAFTDTEECLDGQYEALSNDGMVVWGRNGLNTVMYRMWTSGGWSAEMAGPNVGGETRWVRLARDPASDRIMLGTLDDNSDINFARWSGTGWGAATEVANGATDKNRRCYDVAFEPAGTRALAIYAKSGMHTPFYRVFNGSSWGTEVTGPDLTYEINAFHLTPNGFSQEIFVLSLAKGGNDALNFLRWNGSSLASQTQLEPKTSGGAQHEAFMLARDLPYLPRIGQIQPVAP